MKRFTILAMLACFGLLLAQDAAGTYQLTGVTVRYTNLARQTTVASAADSYGLGVSLPLAVIPINTGFYQLLNGPFNEDNLHLAGALLNVTFNEDGTGTINEGSYYPTVTLNEETCESAGTVLPITDDLVYTSNLTPSNYVQNANYIGLQSMSPFAAINGGSGLLGAISLSVSENLDFFLPGQQAGAYGACQAGYYYDGTPCDVSGATNDCDFYEACASAGYASKGHLIETIEGNGIRDMYVEWHAVDGPLSGSGYGDDLVDQPGSALLDPCQDGLCVANADQPQCFEPDLVNGGVMASPACTEAGEDIDNIFGIPFFGTTLLNPSCGYGDSVVGDTLSVSTGLAGGVTAACIDGFQGDANGNTLPDVYDGCLALEGEPYNLDGYTAATMAIIAACESLGFDTATCTDLSEIAIASVEATTGCYDLTTHTFTPALDASECVDGVEIFTNALWDCNGLYGLTFQSESLCTVAASYWVAQCVYGPGAGRSFQVMAEDFAPWGGFLTWNSVAYSQCAGAGGGDTCNAFLVPDSTVQFDPACLADGDTSDCAGRLIMNMDPLCVPTLQVREVHIDFDEIDDCAHNGDVTLDGTINILDIVNLVQAILGSEVLDDNQFCNADVDGDGVINVLDVVAIVQAILGNRTNDASSVEIFNNNNTVTIDADGYVGAIQMTLSHGDDFSINLTDDAFIADSHTEGNTTKLMVVTPEGNELFSATGSFEIVETIAANSNDYIDVVNPEAISLGSAYPNPFNPTTSFELQVGNSGHVTMNVYNLMGQVVGTLVDNAMDAGNYNITWDATNFSSGMYVVKAETSNGIASQKVMLVK